MFVSDHSGQSQVIVQLVEGNNCNCSSIPSLQLNDQVHDRQGRISIIIIKIKTAENLIKFLVAYYGLNHTEFPQELTTQKNGRNSIAGTHNDSGDGARVCSETRTGADSGHVMLPPSKEKWRTYLQPLLVSPAGVKFKFNDASFSTHAHSPAVVLATAAPQRS